MSRLSPPLRSLCLKLGAPCRLACISDELKRCQSRPQQVPPDHTPGQKPNWRSVNERNNEQRTVYKLRSTPVHPIQSSATSSTKPLRNGRPRPTHPQLKPGTTVDYRKSSCIREPSGASQFQTTHPERHHAISSPACPSQIGA